MTAFALDYSGGFPNRYYLKRARRWLRRRGLPMRRGDIRETAIDIWVFGDGDPRVAEWLRP